MQSEAHAENPQIPTSAPVISVEQRGDLETRMRDDDDFFEVAVWEIKAALTAAYEAGRKSK